jgi:AraC family ethanolamine operon transcriptional activator
MILGVNSPRQSEDVMFDSFPVRPAGRRSDGSPEVTNASVCSLVLTDLDDLALLFPSWDVTFTQISAGPLHVLARCVQVPDVAIRWLNSDRSVQVRGTPRSSQFVITPITEANEAWRFRGRLLQNGDIRIGAPGEALDELYSTNSEGQSIAVDEAVLREILANSPRSRRSQEVLQEAAFRPSSESFRLFHARLDRLNSFCMDNPSSLRRKEVAAQVRAGYLAAVAAVLCHDPRDGKIPGPRSCRQDISRNAEQLMDRHLELPWTAAQICRELSVGRRTLFYAFQEAIGKSPMAYYKIKRLHLVRRALKHADPATTIVREVALSCGFRHQGQFARDYTRHFGERPSETLFSKKAGDPRESDEPRTAPPEYSVGQSVHRPTAMKTGTDRSATRSTG